MASEKNPWLLFIMSQPGKSTTPRIRLWRLLKGLGAAVLRDGVYLLPHRETLRQALEEQVQGVQTLGGAAYVLAVEPVTATDAHFRALFDRREEYAALLTTISQLRATLAETTEAQARRVLQQVRREYEAIVAIDYFPGPAQAQTAQALAEGVTGRPRKSYAAIGSAISSSATRGSTSSRYGYNRWVSCAMRYCIKSSQSPLR